MEVLDDVVVIGTALVVLDESTTENLPVFSFQQVFHFLFVSSRLLVIPLFEESHFTIHE